MAFNGQSMLAESLLMKRGSMRQVWLFLAMMVAGSAAAQVVIPQFRIRPEGSDTVTTLPVKASDCGSSPVVRWTYQPLGQQLCSNLRLWATTSSSCSDDAVPGNSDVSFAEIPQLTVRTMPTGTFQVNLTTVPGFKSSADGGAVCGAVGSTVSVRICGSVTTNFQQCGFGSNGVQKADPLVIEYDGVPPVAPVIKSLRTLDKGLVVTFESNSDFHKVQAQYRPMGQATFIGGPVNESPATSQEVRITGLTNDTTYDVQLVAFDLADNKSDPSGLSAGTPRLTQGFYGQFVAAGGQEVGCVAGVGLLAPALAIWALTRRRR